MKAREKKSKVRPKIKSEEKDMLKSVNDRKVGKAETSRNRKPKKEKSAERDPNMPKKPLTPFFMFMQGFRKIYMEQNPYVKSATAVAKAGGEKWKAMSSGEKVPYEVKAAKSKLDYEWQLNAYYKHQETKADGYQEELDRSSSDQESDESSGSEYGSDDDII